MALSQAASAYPIVATTNRAHNYESRRAARRRTISPIVVFAFPLNRPRRRPGGAETPPREGLASDQLRPHRGHDRRSKTRRPENGPAGAVECIESRTRGRRRDLRQRDAVLPAGVGSERLSSPALRRCRGKSTALLPRLTYRHLADKASGARNTTLRRFRVWRDADRRSILATCQMGGVRELGSDRKSLGAIRRESGPSSELRIGRQHRTRRFGPHRDIFRRCLRRDTGDALHSRQPWRTQRLFAAFELLAFRSNSWSTP